MKESNLMVDQEVCIEEYIERSYLDYSMYVILDRALPDIRDGLKPVHRRILYAMHQLKLDHTAKFKKSARTVGDVLGKYHPHGDSACYEAMVIMAQSFSTRYPLIQGQGNWGSQDNPKSFAAMRYTEAKLDKYAGVLMNDLPSGVTPMRPNFDGTMHEPECFLSGISNILLNGSSGIAVGMATDIPPHNINEVSEALCLMLEKPKIGIDDVMKVIKGPDYPTGGIICSKPSEIREIYETGRGSIRLRARYEIDKDKIIVTELPYRVSGEALLVHIAAMMNAKKLPMIEDVLDESDEKNPVRLVFHISKGTKLKYTEIAEHLLSVTDLEKSVSINMNMLGLDGKPSVKGLVTVLDEWLQFRLASVKSRLVANSAKLGRQLHLVNAMVIIYPSLDRVIEIIRESDNPSDDLKLEFNLDDEQVAYILGTRLRSLSRLERMKIESEKTSLENEIARLESIINSDRRLRSLVKKEIQKIQDEFSDNRRSTIKDVSQAVAISEESLAPSEPVTVSVTKKGWLRCAKGHDYDSTKLSFKTGDSLALQINANMVDRATIMTSDGRSFTLAVKDLPSARGYGDPLSKFLSPAPGAVPVMMIPEQEKGKIVFISANGYGFIGNKEDLVTRNKKGKVIVNTGAFQLHACLNYSDQYTDLALLTKSGRLIVIPSNEIPELSKGKGVKLQGVSQDDEIISASLLKEDQSLILAGSTKSDRWTPSRWSEFKSVRSRKGKQIPKTFGRAINVSGE